MQLGKYDIVVLAIWYVHLEIFFVCCVFSIPMLVGGCFCEINEHIVEIATRSRWLKYTPPKFNIYKRSKNATKDTIIKVLGDYL